MDYCKKTRQTIGLVAKLKFSQPDDIFIQEKVCFPYFLFQFRKVFIQFLPIIIGKFGVLISFAEWALIIYHPRRFLFSGQLLVKCINWALFLMPN